MLGENVDGVGRRLGSIVGILDFGLGKEEGDTDGRLVGFPLVGDNDGILEDEIEGLMDLRVVGFVDLVTVGLKVDFNAEGPLVGLAVVEGSFNVGVIVGPFGAFEGSREGTFLVGFKDGFIDGLTDGFTEGFLEGFDAKPFVILKK